MTDINVNLRKEISGTSCSRALADERSLEEGSGRVWTKFREKYVKTNVFLLPAR